MNKKPPVTDVTAFSFLQWIYSRTLSIETEQRRMEGGQWTDGQIVTCASEGLRKTTETSITIVGVPAKSLFV